MISELFTESHRNTILTANYNRICVRITFNSGSFCSILADSGRTSVLQPLFNTSHYCVRALISSNWIPLSLQNVRFVFELLFPLSLHIHRVTNEGENVTSKDEWKGSPQIDGITIYTYN